MVVIVNETIMPHSICDCLSYTQHLSTVAALMSRWAEFYQEYQSFEKCSQRLDVEMSNMNPFVSDMDAVKTQLDKLKVKFCVLIFVRLFHC